MAPAGHREPADRRPPPTRAGAIGTGAPWRRRASAVTFGDPAATAWWDAVRDLPDRQRAVGRPLLPRRSLDRRCRRRARHRRRHGQVVTVPGPQDPGPDTADRGGRMMNEQLDKMAARAACRGRATSPRRRRPGRRPRRGLRRGRTAGAPSPARPAPRRWIALAAAAADRDRRRRARRPPGRRHRPPAGAGDACAPDGAGPDDTRPRPRRRRRRPPTRPRDDGGRRSAPGDGGHRSRRRPSSSRPPGGPGRFSRRSTSSVGARDSPVPSVEYAADGLPVVYDAASRC